MTTPIYRLLPIVAAWWTLSSSVASGTTYDEYMTCGAGPGRYGRQFHQHHPSQQLPCDLSKDTFCVQAGKQYPWSAVRRFVYENQGLMKRMYGNQRHYNVLRAELVHELYEEMFEEMPKRQQHRFRPPPSPPSLNSRTARYQKNSDANSLKAEERTKSGKKGTNKETPDRSRSMKVVSAGPEANQVRQKASPSSVTQPSSTAPASPSSSSSNLKVPGDDSSNEATEDPASTHGTAPTGHSTRRNNRRPQTDRTTTTTTHTDSRTVAAETETTTADGIHWPPGETTVAMDAMNHDHHMAEEYEDSEATYFPPYSMDTLDLYEDDLWTTLEDFHSTPPTYMPESFDSTLSTMAQEMFTLTPDTASDGSDIDLDDLGPDLEDILDFPSTLSDYGDLTTLATPAKKPPLEAESRTEGTLLERSEIDFDTASVAAMEAPSLEKSESREENVVRPVQGEAFSDPGIDKKPHGIPTNGVVHSDVLEDVKKQTTTPDPLKTMRPKRGVNACPVKEEFVAPYWANNTRGQTLALLNMYPFEQYIQWERCMYEHRQMYCRKGCRCEQQYRLHKLLAFDPTNECKGIFSDWFRFPSCCVCKCYDIPQDLFDSPPRKPRHRFESESASRGFYSDDDDEEDEDDNDDDDDESYLENLARYAEEGEDDDSHISEDDEGHYGDEEEDESVYGGGGGGSGGRESGHPKYVLVSGGRMVNIPPQRRPRLPPRPSSHITSVRATSPSSPYGAGRRRRPPGSWRPPPSSGDSGGAATSPSPPTSSTLGTLDAATPYYYYNMSHHARLLFPNAQPLPLSRIPRSNPEA